MSGYMLQGQTDSIRKETSSVRYKGVRTVGSSVEVHVYLAQHLRTEAFMTVRSQGSCEYASSIIASL